MHTINRKCAACMGWFDIVWIEAGRRFDRVGYYYGLCSSVVAKAERDGA